MIAKCDGFKNKRSDLGIVIRSDVPQELVRLLEMHYGVIGVVEIDL